MRPFFFFFLHYILISCDLKQFGRRLYSEIAEDMGGGGGGCGNTAQDKLEPFYYISEQVGLYLLSYEWKKRQYYARI